MYIFIYIYIIFFLHWQLWKRDEKGTSTEDLVNAAGWERFCHVATVPGNPLDERHHCIVLQYGGASKSPTFREAFIYFIFLYATLSEELVWRCLKMLKVQRLEDHILSLYKIIWWLQNVVFWKSFKYGCPHRRQSPKTRVALDSAWIRWFRVVLELASGSLFTFWIILVPFVPCALQSIFGTC